jgi:hypothetical protein
MNMINSSTIIPITPTITATVPPMHTQTT